MSYENIEVEGQDDLFFAEVEWSMYIDKNYGADADGNRGIRQAFFEIQSIEVRDSEGREVKDQKIIDKIVDNMPEPNENDFD